MWWTTRVAGRCVRNNLLEITHNILIKASEPKRTRLQAGCVAASVPIHSYDTEQ